LSAGPAYCLNARGSILFGFGPSPASGHAIRDIVQDGACSFADISSFRLARFDRLEPDWIDLQGWHDLTTAD
jgi:sarcosine oxidase subunit beta